jgi:hypothetical protein
MRCGNTARIPHDGILHENCASIEMLSRCISFSMFVKESLGFSGRLCTPEVLLALHTHKTECLDVMYRVFQI